MSRISSLASGTLFVFLIVGCKAPVEQDGYQTLQAGEEDISDIEAAPQSGPFAGKGSYPIWAYDPGPNPDVPMGKELIDLNADIPYFPGISEEIYGDQMFRPAFGPIPWRMMLKPNSVKILFIGQDGTHIAEAAGRPATAGFGGRAQDLAMYFGVNSSAAFINTYAFTIRWQYAAFDTPFVREGKYFGIGTFTTNQVWLISQDQDSPIVKWRNSLIDWILRNNRQSLKLIVLFGGAARDAAAAYVISKGGQVGPRRNDVEQVKIPEFDLVYAGGNQQAATPYSRNGRDLYWEFNGSKPNYTNQNEMRNLQERFKQAFRDDPEKWKNRMVFSNGGYAGSGMLEPAQFGGYDIADKMVINGETTISLKGLKISDDYTVSHDILVAQFPHPTALSSMSNTEASQAVARGIASFKKYVDRGWRIEPDPGFENSFAEGESYRYRRGDMGTEHYDFGAPNSRMVNVSTASRMNPNVIVFGTRDRARFDQSKIDAMLNAKPSTMPGPEEMWIARPRGPQSRYVFDPGPGLKYAKLMKTSLPTDETFRRKHSINGDFGHYRGTFKGPQVLIVADPHGEDDLITARALTGTRGQYLHKLMEDLGVGDRYLVIKTAPYSKNGCPGNDWEDIFERTKPYREKLLRAIMEDTTPKLIIADGQWAKMAVETVLPDVRVPVVAIDRVTDAGDAGLEEAVQKIKQAVPEFQNATVSIRMADIPRSHLPYYARIWEGTSGDRVITSYQSQYCGKAFAEVAPRWATSQRYEMSQSDWDGVRRLKQKVDANRLRRGGEKIPDYLNRTALAN